MAKTATKTTKKTNIITVEDKLKALYQLQCIDSNIDNIRVVRGELPLEIQDLEDDISGLNTRIEKYNEELTALDDNLAASRLKKKDAKALIKRYDKQIVNIKNNREYESLSKEIEFQTLEIELCGKKEKEIKAKKLMKDEVISGTKDTLKGRKKELKIKNGELDEITKETEKEEKSLIKKSDKAQKVIEDRLLNAYSRIRDNVRNGLAVVSVDRDACGGCKNIIPPQRQLDIRTHKKVIVCEHCGRILIDANMFDK
jgi:predicted  nucleic acid-binding Zn-ribbon protein